MRHAMSGAGKATGEPLGMALERVEIGRADRQCHGKLFGRRAKPARLFGGTKAWRNFAVGNPRSPLAAACLFAAAAATAAAWWLQLVD